jgi:hypothetical protein
MEKKGDQGNTISAKGIPKNKQTLEPMPECGFCFSKCHAFGGGKVDLNTLPSIYWH